jgi:hypothetical protein
MTDLRTSRYVREGELGEALFWQDRLGLDAVGMASLVTQKILRQHLSSSEKPLWRLDFVGLLMTKTAVFLSLPKIFPTVVGISTPDIISVLTCLQTYLAERRRSTHMAKAGIADFYTDGGNLLNLFLSLLRWTEDHGIHTKTHSAASPEISDIYWPDTVRLSLAVHQLTATVYIDPQGRRSSESISPLGEIQAQALLDLFSKLGNLASLWTENEYELLDECRAVLSDSSIARMGAAELSELLDVASSDITRDADRELAELLLRWSRSKVTGSSQLRFFGTTAFHVVWESMCATALGWHNVATHFEFASQPVFKRTDQELALGAQRPDFLDISDGSARIADAKWHRTDADSVGVQDVVKQIMYEMSLADTFAVTGNCLILPHFSGSVAQHLGEIVMMIDGREDNRFPAIAVVSLRWSSAAEAYRTKLPVAELGMQIDSSR